MPRDYIDAYKLKEHAHMTKDKFLLDIYTSYEKNKSESENFIEKLARRALYSLILLSINYHIYGSKKSISYFILNYLGSSELIWLCSIFLLLLIFFRFHIDNRNCIYCPSMYRDMMEKRYMCMSSTVQTSLRNTRF